MSLQSGEFYFDDQGLPEGNAAGPAVVTFDGRLDNRGDLLLRLRDVLRDDTGDAALALAAYQKWGTDGLVHLIGDWSLGIWDAKERALVLASDFAGVRPLYYCVQQDRVLWSTRLAPLVDHAEASQIDDKFAAGFLVSVGCRDRTPYQGIYSVPPGHSVRVTRDGAAIQPFWKLPIGNTIRYRRESDYDEQLRALFREAVQCRLRTDAPVLSDLSGGLDSSSVVCMASHLIRSGEATAPRMSTISFEHQGSLDERFYKTVAEYCGVENIVVPTASHPLLTEADTGGAMPAFWEPLHTHTGTLARDLGVRTYLTGRMGDLVMGNSGDDTDQVAGLLRKGHIGAAVKQSLAWSKILRTPIYGILGRAFLLSLPPSLARGMNRPVARGYVPASTEDSMAPGFLERTGLSDPQAFFSPLWTQAPPERRKYFRTLTETLELRRLQPPEPLQHLHYTHPYAHRPLVEFMSSIPAAILCGPGEPRRLMRRAFHDMWPPELRRRRSKDSFGSVFLDSLRPLATTLLEKPRLEVVERGYVDECSLKGRLQRLSQSLDCNEGQLRQIILLELWLRGRPDRLGRQAA